MKEIAYNWIDQIESRITEISDEIWKYAEVGLQEFKSAKLQADELKKYGFKVNMGVAEMPTAFVAKWGEGRPKIGYLGEYDALPGLSQKPVPYQEPFEEGRPGHGCAHNLLGTSLIAAALGVQKVMKEKEMKTIVLYI